MVRVNKIQVRCLNYFLCLHFDLNTYYYYYFLLSEGNLPAGEKMPLLDLEMIRKISVYAMTPGRKAVMIISNDLYLTSTFADKLRAQYNELTVITPSVGCMIPVDMYRKKTVNDLNKTSF